VAGHIEVAPANVFNGLRVKRVPEAPLIALNILAQCQKTRAGSIEASASSTPSIEPDSGLAAEVRRGEIGRLKLTANAADRAVPEFAGAGKPGRYGRQEPRPRGRLQGSRGHPISAFGSNRAATAGFAAGAIPDVDRCLGAAESAAGASGSGNAGHG
jgi:hypothetical protein